MSISYYPQAYKIWKTKKSKEVSLLTFSFMSVGTIIWLVYGIVFEDPVIIFSFVVGTIGANLVFFLALFYRKK